MNIVELKGITKRFPAVLALDSVDFQLKEKSIHSLLGENGAGKSTLMKVLYGMHDPNEGEILIKGKKQRLKSPSQAIKNGVGMVHQHFMLAEVMTVAENIIVGDEPVRHKFFLNEDKINKDVQEMIDHYGFNLKANDKVADLSVGQKQKVEILKALYRGVDVLILDEPTAVLTPQEVDELFVTLRQLRDQGMSIILITHKLRETIALADEVSVLRDGRMVEHNIPIETVTIDDLARLMVGRDIQLNERKPSPKIGETLFEAEQVTLERDGKNVLNNISFKLNAGEILGVAGIEGNGQTELIEVLTGLSEMTSGRLKLHGQEINGHAKDFIKHGIGHIPEDRSTRGLVNLMTIRENLILGYEERRQFSENGWFKREAVKNFAQNCVQKYGIKTRSDLSTCASLSGGNQQKVVIARVFEESPEVIIIAQPSRGVDIGAQEYIHQRIFELRDSGCAILLISADLDEVRKLADRLVVIYEGEFAAEVDPETSSETELGLLMAGKGGHSDEA